jgi:flavin reductase (DIM6/NTAB) family NADH-FMN oxidoreductase RutF
VGWPFLLGLVDETKTANNVRRHSECVVNLPTPEMWENVERLAPLTGKNPVPEIKATQFHYEPEKFNAAGLTPLESELVEPSRVKECPIQMEARVRTVKPLGGARLEQIGGGVAAEIEIVRVHVASDLVMKDYYVDPAKWSPLIYNFRHYYRLAKTELGRTFRAQV